MPLFRSSEKSYDEAVEQSTKDKLAHTGGKSQAGKSFGELDPWSQAEICEADENTDMNQTGYGLADNEY